MATETLKFRVKLCAIKWDKPPYAEVKLNNEIFFSDFVSATEADPKVIEFDKVCEENKTFNLDIILSKKDSSQTVVSEDGDIIKDQLLKITSIEVDDIDIATLIYEGVYTPKYSEPWASQQRKSGKNLPESFKNVTQLGHNGTWSLQFETPFYMWLLENLY
jgi:hypothetical protein